MCLSGQSRYPYIWVAFKWRFLPVNYLLITLHSPWIAGLSILASVNKLNASVVVSCFVISELANWELIAHLKEICEIGEQPFHKVVMV